MGGDALVGVRRPGYGVVVADHAATQSAPSNPPGVSRCMSFPFSCLAPFAALILLAGCGTSADRQAPDCPALARLPDAATLTRYAGPGRDLRDLVLSASIAQVPATCTQADAGHVRASLQVVVDLQRGPAAPSATAELTYFVAVLDAGRVRDEQDYRIVGTFPPNVDNRELTSAPVELLLPVTPQKSAAAYQIFVGFRLSPEELEANRKPAQ